VAARTEKSHHPAAVAEDSAGRSGVAPGERRVFAAEDSRCKFCFGTGLEVIPGKGARRCGCRTEERKARLLEAARIPERFAECSFSNYKPDADELTQILAYAAAFRLAEEYPEVERGLLFTGPVGRGRVIFRSPLCES
jgi:DNA replication protein DnaC